MNFNEYLNKFFSIINTPSDKSGEVDIIAELKKLKDLASKDFENLNYRQKDAITSRVDNFLSGTWGTEQKRRI